jgi:protein-tyrosine phosphatase
MFSHSELIHPGEYGRPEKTDGWVMLQVPELSNQTLYLTSENFGKKLSAYHDIPAENIVSLIAPAPLSKHGVPEEPLSGPEGLAMFQERFANIGSEEQQVLIHCKQGSNRTPVAAVLYLMSHDISFARASELVTNAYREQRDEKFVLDKRGYYAEVLKEADALQSIIKADFESGGGCKRNAGDSQHENAGEQRERSRSRKA